MRKVSFIVSVLLSFFLWSYVGSETCISCHEEQGEFFQKTAHKNAFFLGEEGRGCEACHGEGDTHADTNEAKDIRGVSALASWGVEEQTKACLSCHNRNLHRWQGSIHEGSVSCWDCHQEMLHFKKEKRASCTSCHGEMKVRKGELYRHRMACTSCHDPHGELPTEETCFTCHQEYRGPFLYEHEAMDEGCGACHNPHGTSTRRLLRMSGNGLCLQCHAQSDYPAIGKTVHSTMLQGGALCYDCHIQVHGSNTDPNFNPRLR